MGKRKNSYNLEILEPEPEKSKHDISIKNQTLSNSNYKSIFNAYKEVYRGEGHPSLDVGAAEDNEKHEFKKSFSKMQRDYVPYGGDRISPLSETRKIKIVELDNSVKEYKDKVPQKIYESWIASQKLLNPGKFDSKVNSRSSLKNLPTNSNGGFLIGQKLVKDFNF